MLVQSAEESFQAGMSSFAAGNGKHAMALFEAAIQLELRFGESRPQARYLSYYGLALALERNEVREGLRFCREAVTQENYNPDLRCNLGRVLIRAGRRKEAYQAFLRGLRLQSDHARLRREIRALGIRRRPVLPFLDRANPINVFLGRLRAPLPSTRKRAAQSNRQRQGSSRVRAQAVAHRTQAR